MFKRKFYLIVALWDWWDNLLQITLCYIIMIFVNYL